MPILTASVLTRFAESILTAAGAPPRKAAIVAQSLVASNLRGVDSHGIQLLPFYAARLLGGLMDGLADGRVISRTGACLLFDGQNAIGQWVAQTCCAHAVRLARKLGVGMVVARESNHFGAAAFWSGKMRAAGQIGIVMCNASAIVPPWQGREGRIGTNPISMAVPGPWLLDMATTTVAAGKIFKAYFNGEPSIPAGWAFGPDGSPTTDTVEAYKGTLMPLGGYKGSGLGMMVEILCGVLGGAAMSTEVGGIRTVGRPMRTGQMYLAIDVARFLPMETFTARMEELVRNIKATPAGPGYDEVLVAGDPEWRTEAERRLNGIPINDGNWRDMLKAAERVGVAPPRI